MLYSCHYLFDVTPLMEVTFAFKPCQNTIDTLLVLIWRQLCCTANGYKYAYIIIIVIMALHYDSVIKW